MRQGGDRISGGCVFPVALALLIEPEVISAHLQVLMKGSELSKRSITAIKRNSKNALSFNSSEESSQSPNADGDKEANTNLRCRPEWIIINPSNRNPERKN